MVHDFFEDDNIEAKGVQDEVTSEAKKSRSNAKESVNESMGRGHRIKQPSIGLHD